MGEALKSHDDYTVTDLFGGKTFYEIPPYQREYQWGPEMWMSLWRDLGQLTTEEDRTHFFGILLLEEIEGQATRPVRGFRVIDGQQRLVTLLVLMAVLRDREVELSGHQEEDHDALAFIQKPRGRGTVPRIKAQDADQDALHKAVAGGWEDWFRSVRRSTSADQIPILWAYTYFRFLLGLQGSFNLDEIEIPLVSSDNPEEDIESLWQENQNSGEQRLSAADEVDRITAVNDAIDRLTVVELIIGRDDEDPPTIFESINAKRTELEQWDFVRNLIFTRFDPEQGKRIFDDHWSSAQTKLANVTWEGLRSEPRDAFMYDYVIARGEAKFQKTIARNRGYEHFRKRLNRVVPPTDVDYRSKLEDFVVADILSAADAWPVAVGYQQSFSTSSQDVGDEAYELIESIRRISSGPPFPMILHFLEHWRLGNLSTESLVRELHLLENFLVRMVVSRRPLSPLRANLIAAMAELTEGKTPTRNQTVRGLSSLIQGWKARNLVPTDVEIRSAFDDKPFYKKGKNGGIGGNQLGAIFRGIERQLAGAGAHPLPYGKSKSAFTVEHIFPQSCVAPPYGNWAAAMPATESARQKLVERVHRAGNLTLVTKGVNSSLKNKSFADKKRVLGSSNEPPRHPLLRINESITSKTSWSAKAIDQRSKKLASDFLARWPMP